MENNPLTQAVIADALSLGAYKASVIPTAAIELDAAFRRMCEANACGVYGKCWMCPPDVGGIDELMASVASYDYALVYQTVSALEDSYDFEGMQEAKKQHYKLSAALRTVFDQQGIHTVLHLGCGGCGVCDVCAKRSGEPCRFPHLALPSLEAYGVNVSQLAKKADMRYVNGQNTVTYFGAVLIQT